MIRLLRGVTVLVVLCGLLPMQAVVAQEPARVGSLEEEMAGLNRSVRQMVELLRVYLERQESEIILKRIELKIYQLEPLAGELRGKRSRQRSVEEHIEHIEMNIRQMEDLLFEGKDSMSENESRQTRQRLKATQDELRMQKEKAWLLEQEAQDLESQVLVRRREIAALEDAADRLFAR